MTFFLKPRLLCFLISGMLLTHPLPAQDTPPWMDLVQRHAEHIEAGDLSYDLALVRLKKSYHSALENLMPVAQQQGDLSFFTAIETEIKRTDQVPSVPAGLSTFPELAKVQGILIAELERLQSLRAAAVVDSYQKLDEALKGMQQYFVQQGRIQEAKDLEAFRQETLASDRYLKARKWMDRTPPAEISSGIEVASNVLTLDVVQAFFKGKVTTFNSITKEIEIWYGFDAPEELEDFSILRPESYSVQDGRLTVLSPAGTDWWWLRPNMRCDYLVIPYLETDKSMWVVELSSMKPSQEFHFAFGYSDLIRRTVGMGPFSRNKEFTVEGWTPKDEQLRGESSGISTQFPAVITVEHRGNKIDFGVQAGGRKKTVTVRTDESVQNLGLFPKSWKQDDAELTLESFRIRGVLSAEWLEAQRAGN
jgi:hypothetical protein